MENIFYPILWVIIFILSATMHEAAHAWAAKRGGDLTAYAGGQVSLDPLPHIKRQPLGMVVFPLISSFILGWPFGYASAPYDSIWAYNHPRRAAWMAAAGPAANLLLMVLCAVVIKMGILGGIFLEPDSVGFRHIVDPGPGNTWNGLSIFISMMFSLNLIMLVLNLIPLPPLDGSGIISLFLKESSARSYQTVVTNPIFAFVGLIIAWRVFDPLINSAFPWIINILYWGANFR
ncbi:MAG: site-2 protease family protein [Chloroflexi bacterium]|nr:site-2 protease family protein [Chloroflexota bacterium]